MMPRLSGVETARQLREIRGDLPVLFATGYDQEAVSRDLLDQPDIKLIRKPWKPDQLDAMIKSLI